MKNLNPNAQHFMTSDFTNGTVLLTGSAIPSGKNETRRFRSVLTFDSDDPYGEHGADFHLRSAIYPGRTKGKFIVRSPCVFRSLAIDLGPPTYYPEGENDDAGQVIITSAFVFSRSILSS